LLAVINFVHHFTDFRATVGPLGRFTLEERYMVSTVNTQHLSSVLLENP